jgi:predicted transcriptional regulator
MIKPVRRAMMPRPLTINATEPLTDAARRMRAWGITDVLVIDDHERLIGRLTARHITVAAIATGRHPASVTAGESCDRTLPTVDADDPVDRAADLMRLHGLQRLPVLDGDRLIGTVWASELAASTRHHHPFTGSDTGHRRMESSR